MTPKEGDRVQHVRTGATGSALLCLPEERYELPVRVLWDCPKNGVMLPTSWEAVEDLSAL